MCPVRSVTYVSGRSKTISYLELQKGQKLGCFLAFPRTENSQRSSDKGPNASGEPNFLRIFEPAKSV